jgi:hypothetical protein
LALTRSIFASLIARASAMLWESSAMTWVVSAAVWVVYAGGIGWYVASAKGRGGLEGIILGVLAGPVGWLVVALLPGDIPVPPVRTAPGRIGAGQHRGLGHAGCCRHAESPGLVPKQA